MKRFRKLYAVVLVGALLLAALNPTVATAAVDYSYIKVKLTSMGTPSSVQFKVAGAYRIAEASGVDLFPNITYTIKTDGSGMKLTYSNGVSTANVSLPATATFVQYSNGSSSNFLYVNNPGYGWRYYSGNMAFTHPSGQSYLELVNNVYIETYLCGVIAYEMGDDWPIEALKAQAVCARTYAEKRIKSNPGASYHIVDTSANQVYKGYPFDSAGRPQLNVINAVEATRGAAIVCGDPALLGFADGVYSASNGGQIRTANMRWGSANTYHVFKDDPYDLANASSPAFTFIFPVENNSATLNLLSANDRNKADTMLALVKTKLAAALLAQQGVSCADSDIKINGISAAAPSALRSGVPAESREFTKITLTVNVTANNSTIIAPSESVSWQGIPIDNGASAPSAANGTDFGAAALGADPVTRTYMITNSGNAALSISGITLTGANAGDFSLSTPLPTSVAAGGSGMFTVAFSPKATGDRTALVTISSNDPQRASYTFSVKGTGSQQPQAAPQTAQDAGGGDQQEGPGQGGGGMPAATFTGNVTVDLCYIAQAPDGDWDVPGELRTVFSNFSSLLNSTNLWELYGSASADGKFLYVVARGYGHGVGLSQRGAQQMANQGKTCAEILDFYYNIGAGLSSTTTVSTTPKTLTEIPGKSSKTWGKVTSSTLNVRATTSTSSTAVGALARDDIVEILDTLSGGWYKVLRGSTGLIGYVSSSYVIKTTQGPTPTAAASASPTPAPSSSGGTASPASTPTPLMGRINASSLSMRSQPNTNGSVIFTLYKGDTVLILDAYAADNWYKVKYASYVGYCMATSTTTEYVEIIGNAPAAPTGGTSSPSGPIVLGAVTAKCNVSSGTLTIRKSPSTSADKYATAIPKGATFTVLEVNTTATWLKISYSGTTGYVMKKYAAISGNTSYQACTVTTAVNCRSGAGTNYGVLGTLRSGDTLVCTSKVTTSSGTWYKVIAGSYTGYIDSRYARISKDS
jgi:SpoIID/LytB domain protein